VWVITPSRALERREPMPEDKRRDEQQEPEKPPEPKPETIPLKPRVIKKMEKDEETKTVDIEKKEE
jgi:hypothetical protein